MNLKQRSIIISVVTTITLIVTVTGVVFGVITVQFQKLEDQRVERNIRRISAILDDRFSQLSSKLTDWSNWDDTYKFIKDNNKEYIQSNLIPENFKNIGVDEALFLNKDGGLVASIISIEEPEGSGKFPEDLYQSFATGSALLDIKEDSDYNQGLLKTDNGILLFVVRKILPSSTVGESRGTMVFAKYLDESVLNSMKDLTQFETHMRLWNDQNLPSDYQKAKENYSLGQKQMIQRLNRDTISGYLVVEDIYHAPQAIIRGDIERDITKQGVFSMELLIGLLIIASSLSSTTNYYLLVKMVLGKVSQIAADVDTLAQSGTTVERLKTGSSSDEVDKLRVEINNMLDSLHKSKTELSAEKQKGESLIDLINAIVVTLDPEGKVISINKSGLEKLGYKLQEVPGKDWFETFIPEASRKSINLHFKELISGNLEDNAHIDNDVLTKDGKVILVSWHNTLVKDQSGKVISTISLGEDVTAEKQEEKKKETYAKELERLNELMVNRELKMIALKEELEKYKK